MARVGFQGDVTLPAGRAALGHHDRVMPAIEHAARRAIVEKQRFHAARLRQYKNPAGGMLAAATVGRSGRAAAADPSERFNILWLIADQHTFGALGCAGNPVVKTPNLDHLAAYQKEGAARAGAAFSEALFREYIRCYYGMVTMMDAWMGRILDALKRLGLEENTLVIYTSDHGNNVASHGFVDKGVKAFYEEVLRVPLILRYPGHIRPGSVFQCSAESVDLMPTLLDYAGAPVPAGVQGRSLRPIIEGRAPDVFDAAFCERGLGSSGENGPGAWFARMIRTSEAKYSYFSDGRRELFDLAKDPYEMKDVAQDPSYKRLRDSLHARLVDQARRTGDPAASHIPSA